MRLAEELRLDAETRSDLFYALLLKDAGCTANAARMAALFGADDHELKHSAKRVDWARQFPAFVWSVRAVAPHESPRAKLDRLLAIKDEGEVTRSLMQARCDRGAEIARMIGLSERTAEAIRTLDEHWDGHGQPRWLAGDEIPLLGRILCLAQTVEIFHAAGGVDGAYAVAGAALGHSGSTPSWCRRSAPSARTAASGPRCPSPTSPAGSPRTRWSPSTTIACCQIATAFAAIVDAKSSWTYFHSDRTSVIATSIGAALGLEHDELRDLRYVALLHDIGKLAISNRILDKPSELTDAEFERVKEHPLFTQWVLERVSCFEDLAPVAAAHHERLDGSGYPRGLDAYELTLPMRVLAVADVYEALTAERPYRHALPEDEALEIMRDEVPRRLDADAYEALVAVIEGPPVR